MNISGIPSSLLNTIANDSSAPGDAVTIATLKKALDLQAQSAAVLIAGMQESLPQAPDPSSRVGQMLDVKA